MSILIRKPNTGNRGSLEYNSTPFTFYKGAICHLDKILGTPPPLELVTPPPLWPASTPPPPLAKSWIRHCTPYTLHIYCKSSVALNPYK